VRGEVASIEQRAYWMVRHEAASLGLVLACFQRDKSWKLETGN
jgi:hypothetical protein